MAEEGDRRKGEFVLIVEGGVRPPAEEERVRTERVLTTLLAELPLKQAVALTVKLTGGSKNKLYALALERRGRA